MWQIDDGSNSKLQTCLHIDNVSDRTIQKGFLWILLQHTVYRLVATCAPYKYACINARRHTIHGVNTKYKCMRTHKRVSMCACVCVCGDSGAIWICWRAQRISASRKRLQIHPTKGRPNKEKQRRQTAEKYSHKIVRQRFSYKPHICRHMYVMCEYVRLCSQRIAKFSTLVQLNNITTNAYNYSVRRQSACGICIEFWGAVYKRTSFRKKNKKFYL